MSAKVCVAVFHLKGCPPSDQEVAGLKGRLNEKLVQVNLYEHDDTLCLILYRSKPDVIVSIGSSFEPFDSLNRLSHTWRCKWIHVKSLDDLNVNRIYHCYFNTIFLGSGMQLSETTGQCVQKTSSPGTAPSLISMFTTCYESKHRIFRPFHSLQQQTHDNWEWVIYDDSKDREQTWQTLQSMTLSDPRIRIFRSDRNNGKIGEVKQIAAALCRGEFLLELDHDDELTETALEEAVSAFQRYPEVGFVYSDFAEPYEHGKEPLTNVGHVYGDFYGGGYWTYRKELYRGRWYNTAVTANQNSVTMRHIVGVPNHFRCWRTSVYQQLKGYAPGLSVADDYDLLVRTFLRTRMLRIPKLLYLQYRNDGQNNFTNIRNELIQEMVCYLSHYYRDAIHDRLLELGLEDPDHHSPNPCARSSPCWESLGKKPESHATLYPDPCWDSVAVVMILPHDYFHPKMTFPQLDQARKKLRGFIQSLDAQTHQRWTLFLIGNDCPFLELFMSDPAILQRKDQRICWWNLSQRSDVPLNFVAHKLVVSHRLVTYVDPKEELEEWRTGPFQRRLETMLAGFVDGEQLSQTEPTFQHSFVMFPSQTYGTKTSGAKTSGTRTSDETRDTKSPQTQECHPSIYTMMHDRDLWKRHGYFCPNNAPEEIIQRWQTAGEPWILL